MIRVTKTFVRPTTEVRFFEGSTDANATIKANFADTGKRLSITKVVAGLTQTVTSEWINQAAYDEFNNNSAVKEWAIQRKAYLKANGITTTKPTITEI